MNSFNITHDPLVSLARNVLEGVDAPVDILVEQDAKNMSDKDLHNKWVELNNLIDRLEDKQGFAPKKLKDEWRALDAEHRRRGLKEEAALLRSPGFVRIMDAFMTLQRFDKNHPVAKAIIARTADENSFAAQDIAKLTKVLDEANKIWMNIAKRVSMAEAVELDEDAAGMLRYELQNNDYETMSDYEVKRDPFLKNLKKKIKRVRAVVKPNGSYAPVYVVDYADGTWEHIVNGKVKYGSVKEDAALFEELSYNSGFAEIAKTAAAVSSLPGAKLSAFFTDLSDAFMKKYDEDASRVDAKSFAKDSLALAKRARSIN